MKRKFLTILLALLMALILGVGISACDTSPSSADDTYTQQPSGPQTPQGGDDVPQGDDDNGNETPDDKEDGDSEEPKPDDKDPDDSKGDDGDGEEPEPPHTHEFSPAWSSDDEKHWHDATCGHPITQDEALHTYENGICTTCRHAHENHTYENGVCTVCFYVHENHTYENGVCTVCFYAHEAHTFDDWAEKQQPTCTKEGYKEHTCTVCHKTVGEAIPVSEHTFENGICTACGTPQRFIAFKTLKTEGDNVYGKVPSTTEYFSFLNEIVSADGVSYHVYTSRDCKDSDEIPSASPSLAVGDNTFFVLARKGNDRELYTVTIRRLPVYALSFETDGSPVPSQTVEEGSVATMPQETQKRGYTFVHWTLGGEEVSFPYLVDESSPAENFKLTFTAVFSANSYTVTLDPSGGEVEKESQSVRFDANFTFPIPTRTGHTFLGWFDGEEKLTEADGSGVGAWGYDEDKTLHAHWSVNSYTLTLERNLPAAGEIEGEGAHAHDYGSEITLSALTYRGYIFLGWFDGSDCVYEAPSVTFPMGLDGTLTATWKVDPAMEPFDFTSDEVSCRITAVRDTDTAELFIPAYVTDLDGSLFEACTALERITVAEGNAHYSSAGGILFNAQKTAILCIPAAIREVTLPDTITSIPAYLFSGRGLLTSVFIPESVTEIDASAFRACSSLSRIDVAAENANYAAQDGVLYDKAKSALVFVPIAIEGEISLLEGLSAIPSQAFHQRNSLTGVIISKSVETINFQAFENCAALESVTFAKNSRLNAIGSYAFRNCPALESVTFAGESALSVIDTFAFQFCTALKSICIPDSVTQIKQNAFQQCTSLEKVEIGRDCLLEVIGAVAFRGCRSLSGIVIPAHVREIGSNAFFECRRLVEIWNYSSLPIQMGSSKHGSVALYARGIYQTEEASKQVWEGEFLFYESEEGSALIACASEASALSLPAASPSGKPYTVGREAFSENSTLNALIIPANVTKIERSAFSQCAALERVRVEGGTLMTSIEESAFSECPHLVSFVFEGEAILGSLGRGAFYNCAALERVDIPASVTSIGDYAFEACSALSTVKIADIGAWCAIDFISGNSNPLQNGASLYLDDSPLTEIDLTGVTKIGQYAFNGYAALKTITLSEQLTEVGMAAFQGCALESVRISDIKAWCAVLFKDRGAHPLNGGGTLLLNDSPLTELDGLAGVTKISPLAFLNCTTLITAVIPDSVTEMGVAAFAGCNRLQSITIPFVGDTAKTEDDLFQYPFGYIFGDKPYEGGQRTEQHYFEDSLSSRVYSYLYIPETLRRVVVTSGEILAGAFYNCSMLESIVLPAGGTMIGENAFYSCRSLKAISIPESVTKIGEKAFYQCSGLSQLVVPVGVKEIGKAAFGVCRLESLTIPFVGTPEDPYLGYFFGSKKYTENSYQVPDALRSVTITSDAPVGNYAFYGLKNLTAVTMSGNVTSIGAHAFEGCTALADISLPSGMPSIGDYAFKGCTALLHITLPKSLTVINANAFDACDALEHIDVEEGSLYFTAYDGILYRLDTATGQVSSLVYAPLAIEGDVTVPEGVTSVGQFESRTSLSGIALPSTLTSVGAYAFRYCSALKSVTFAEGCRAASIWSYAFYGCSLLSTLVLPDTVNKIGYHAFERSGLRSITLPSIVDEKGETTFLGKLFGAESYELPEGFVPATLEEVHLTKATAIAAYAFFHCDHLKCVSIPKSMVSIEYNAFCECTALEKVNIQGLDAWCKIAFSSDYSNPLCLGAELCIDGEPITEVSGIEGITEIKQYAFYGCDPLKKIVIPASVTKIGEEAFGGCGAEIVWAGTSALTNISANAFDGYLGTHIAIPASVTEIGAWAFNECKNLQGVTFEGEQLTKIGNSAFYLCTALTSLAIPESVVSIGSSAFQGCTALESVTFGDASKLTAFNYSTFRNCSALQSIVIPRSVTSIRNTAFTGCTSLKEAVFEEPNGWTVTKNSSDQTILPAALQDPATAAAYLWETFVSYDWTRA